MPVLGEADIRAAAARGERMLVIGTELVVTPQALETADRLGVELRRSVPQRASAPGSDPGRAVARTLYRRSPKWVAQPPRRGAAPTRFTRVAVVGCGAVGATTAHLLAQRHVCDELVLVDLVPGLAAATALDIEHASGITRSPTRARGATSVSEVSGAQVLVVTAGRPRTPGMSRAALLEVNGRVIRDVAEAVAARAPDATVVVVTNPVDEMTSVLWQSSGLPPRRVLGMAGTLDSSRFRNAIAVTCGVRPGDVEAMTLGSHGDEMVPVVSAARVRGRPLRDVLPAEEIARCVRETVEGGAAVVGLRRTASASIAPAHAIVEVLDAMRQAVVEAVPVSALPDRVPGLEPVFIGLPCRLDIHGVREIALPVLDPDEMAALRAASAAIAGRLGQVAGQ